MKNAEKTTSLKPVTGLCAKYDEQPELTCRRLNKTLVGKCPDYFCIIDAEDEGYYIVRLSWAIANDFLYTIYF